MKVSKSIFPSKPNNTKTTIEKNEMNTLIIPILLLLFFLFIFIFMISIAIHYNNLKITLTYPKAFRSTTSISPRHPLERSGTQAVPIDNGFRALIFSGVKSSLSRDLGIIRNENKFLDDIVILSAEALSKLGDQRHKRNHPEVEIIDNAAINPEMRPHPRAFHAMAASTSEKHVYIWGGATYALEDPVSRFRPSFSFPDDHLMRPEIHSEEKSSIVIHNNNTGIGSKKPSGDYIHRFPYLGVWELDTRMFRWRYLNAVNEGPKQRIGSFGFFRDQAFHIFGGMDRSLHQHNDIWAFNITTKTWHCLFNGEKISSRRSNHTAVPSPRYSPTAVYGHRDDRLYVYNGLHGQPMHTVGSRWINLNHTDDFWTFDFRHLQWQRYELPNDHVSKVQGVMSLIYNPKNKQHELIHVGGDQYVNRVMYTDIERPTNPSNEVAVIQMHPRSNSVSWKSPESNFLWMNAVKKISFLNSSIPSSFKMVQTFNDFYNVIPEVNLPFGTSLRRRTLEGDDSVVIIGGGYTVKRDNERGEKLWNRKVLLLNYV